MVKELGDKIDTTLSRERQRRPGLRALDRAARAHRPQADLHDLVRLHGPDAEGREEISERHVRARHRLQARREPRAPIPAASTKAATSRAMIAAKMSKTGTLGYIGSFPIPEVDLRHQRHHARRADDQPEHQGQDHLGEHLVRSRQGSRRRQGARSTRAPTSSCSTPTARPRCRSRRSAACSPSARTPT